MLAHLSVVMLLDGAGDVVLAEIIDTATLVFLRCSFWICKNKNEVRERSHKMRGPLRVAADEQGEMAELADMVRCRRVMSTHASVLVDSVGPPSAEVCRAAASFP
jgi:hypothetical protein